MSIAYTLPYEADTIGCIIDYQLAANTLLAAGPGSNNKQLLKIRSTGVGGEGD